MNEADRHELGLVIRQERKRRGLTQPQLAQLASVSTRTIASIEKGEHATQEGNTAAVMRALDLDVDGTGARSSWPADIAVFLDMLGAYLATMNERDRLQMIGQLTRSIYRQQERGGN